MLPVPSWRSNPPIRCTNPGVPGIAHGRVSLSSREYGRKSCPFGEANPGSIDGKLSTSGIGHGSEEFAMKVSESKITGVRYRTAIRAASSAAVKHSAGVDADTIGSGDSPWRPYIASRRSACSVFVGIPVEGPDRFRLQVDPRSARPGDGELAAERGAERDVGGRDLVLRLDRDDAEVLVSR